MSPNHHSRAPLVLMIRVLERPRRRGAKPLEQPAVVQPVDPRQRREFHGFDAAPPPSSSNQLRLA